MHLYAQSSNHIATIVLLQHAVDQQSSQHAVPVLALLWGLLGPGGWFGLALFQQHEPCHSCISTANPAFYRATCCLAPLRRIHLCLLMYSMDPGPSGAAEQNAKILLHSL